MGSRTKNNVALYNRPAYLDLIARLAANTRRLRTERAWTQAVAAERCEMALFVFQTVETGRENFSGTLIARLVDGFGVDVRELFAPAPPLAARPSARRGKMPDGATVVGEVVTGEVGLSEPVVQPGTVIGTEADRQAPAEGPNRACAPDGADSKAVPGSGDLGS